MTTWTPATRQVEAWTAEVFPTRVFDPAIFENTPVFDTGSPSGVWTARTKQAETWTVEAAP